MTYSHWNYFLSIEEGIINASKFIEIHKKNFGTFSIELVRLYLSICSEIDVVIKLLCQEINPIEWENIIKELSENKEPPDKEYPDMDIYRNFIHNHFPKLYNIKIMLLKYDGIEFTPWKNLNRNISPEWWYKYNKVKHLRDKHYRDANLKNVLDSAAGLLLILIYFCGYKNIFSLHESIKPKLFSIPHDHLSVSAVWASPYLVIPNP